MSKIQLFILILKRRVITIQRIVNFLLVSISYFLRTRKVIGSPPAMMIEPTTCCNLKCPGCPAGNGTLGREKGIMTFDLFKNIIDEFGDKIIHLTLWGYGEPFLVKDIYEMITCAKRKRIFVRTSTNGHFFSKRESVEQLVESGLDNLIIALDGATQETLTRYRIGANFEEIVRGMKYISEIKKEKRTRFPFVELQFIVMKHNEHEIPLMETLALDVGADKLTIKTPGEEYFANDVRLRRNVKKNKKCSRLWFSSVINWDGTVIPCCYDPDGQFTFGIVDYARGKVFKDIWNNEKYVSFRDKVSKYKDSIRICRQCHGSFASLNIE